MDLGITRGTVRAGACVLRAEQLGYTAYMSRMARQVSADTRK